MKIERVQVLSMISIKIDKYREMRNLIGINIFKIDFAIEALKDLYVEFETLSE